MTPEIVVTARPALTHLLSPEIMSNQIFAFYKRDDNALRAARNDAFAWTGVDYDIVPQERQMAAEYIYMGDFAQLHEYAPANFHAGDRLAPGGLENIAGKL